MVRSSQVRPQIASRKLTVTTLAAAISIANGGAQAQSVEATSVAVRGRAPVVTIQGITNEDVPGQAPKTGHHLHVDATVTDPDNDAITETRYEWKRDATVVGTGADYTATTDDAGKTLTVQITADTDPSITDPTEGTASESVAVTANSKPKAEDVSVMGTTLVGQIMTGLFRYTDVDNDPEGEHAFQWYRADDALGTNAVPIAEATHQIYMLTSDDQGKFVLFGVKPRSRTGDAREGDEERVAAANAVEGRAPTANPTISISGTLGVGAVLTANPGYDDVDNDPQGGTTYQWCSYDESGATLIECGAASTTNTKTLTGDDVGRRLSVKVSPKSSSGQPDSGEEVESVKTNIVPGRPPVASAQSVDGELKTGKQLKAIYTFTDADNDAQEGTTFQWFKHKPGVYYTAISELSTSDTYELKGADQGDHFINVQITPKTATGNPNSGTMIQAQTTSKFLGTGPVMSNLKITGRPTVGSVIAFEYDYTDDQDDPEGEHVYNWCRVNVTCGIGSSGTYTLQAADVGRQIDGRIIPKSAGGNPNSGTQVFSARWPATGTIQNETAPTATVSISGTARAGGELTGSYTYTDINNDAEGATTMQWYIATDAAGTDRTAIDGATSNKITVRTEDQGKYFVFEVTPRSVADVPNAEGASTRAVSARINSAPTASPTITYPGTLTVGTVLTANSGYLDADNDLEAGTTYSWCSGDECSEPSSTNTWTVAANNVGSRISVRVVPKSATGQPDTGAMAQSAETDVVEGRAPEARSPDVSVNPAGAPRNGSILTANYTYFDADNDSQGGTTFQWFRKAGESATDIADATGSSYTLTAADQGDHHIGVRITPKSTTGTPNTGATVEAQAGDKFLGSGPVMSNLRITGTRATVGSVVEFEYDYDDAQDDPEGDHEYDWCRVGATCAIGNARTYTIQAADVGSKLDGRVTPKSSSGNPDTGAQALAPEWPVDGTIQNEAAPTATVSISGTAQVGNELTGSYTYADVNNDEQGETTMQWYTATDAAGASRTAITGATTNKFTVRSEDQGKYFVFEVTPRSVTGVPQVDGTPTRAVSAKVNTAPEAQSPNVGVSPSGALKTGTVLSANYTYHDADNDAQGGTSFQWFRKAGSTITDIASATGSTYTLTGADQGDQYIGVKITPKSATGNPNTGATVLPQTADKFLGTGPVMSNLKITGRPTVGSVIEFDYDYTDEQDDPEGEHVYTWCRVNVACGIGSSATYTLQAADLGRQIDGRIIPKSIGGNPNSGTQVFSARWPDVGTIQNEAAPTATVSISGAAQVGNELTGSYTYADINNDGEGATTMQWYTATDAAGTSRTVITGATTNKFTVRSEDQGKYFVFEVTPRSVTGVPQVDGSPTRAVSAKVNTAPEARTPSVGVSPSGALKNGTVLTANYTYFDADNDAQSGTTFQWFRRAGSTVTDITNATGSTYTLTGADQGDQYIGVKITPKSATGNPNTGATVLPQTADKFLGTGPVMSNLKITGRPTVGSVIEFDYDYTDEQDDPEGEHVYTWCRVNVACGIGSSATYTLQAADLGRQIDGRVTPRSAGGNPNSGTQVFSARWPDVGTIQNEAAPTATVSISGMTQAGSELTGSYVYTDVNNDAEGATTTQWYTATDAAGTIRTVITGATTNKFTVRSEDAGKYFVFEVTPRSVTGVPQVDGAATHAVSARINTAPEARTPSVGVSPSGALKNGTVLTANYTYFDADNDAQSGTTFQWFRKAGSTVTDITNATSSTYTLSGADQGDHYIGVKITPKSGTGNPNTGTTVLPQTADKPLAVAPTATASIAGTAQVGIELTGSHSYTDGNNDNEGATSRQWYTATDSSGTTRTTIAGATTNKFTVRSGDQGKWMVYEVTPRSVTGVPEINGNPVRAVSARVNSAPTANPTISFPGTLAVGTVLTANSGYQDVDNDAQSGTLYQWCWYNSAGTTLIGCGTASTSNTYTVVSANQDNRITVKVTPKSATGSPNTGDMVESAKTAVVPIMDLPSGTSPTIEGSLDRGQELTASFAYTNGGTGSGTGQGAHVYTWYRANNAQGTSGKTQVATGTSNKYMQVDADQGKYIIVEITPKSANGTSGTTISANTPKETRYRVSGPWYASGIGNTMSVNLPISNRSGNAPSNLKVGVWRQYQDYCNSSVNVSMQLQGPNGTRYTLTTTPPGSASFDTVNASAQPGNGTWVLRVTTGEGWSGEFCKVIISHFTLEFTP